MSQPVPLQDEDLGTHRLELVAENAADQEVLAKLVNDRYGEWIVEDRSAWVRLSETRYGGVGAFF